MVRPGTDLHNQLADHIGQLVERKPHTERFFTWNKTRHRQWHNHVTWHPSLLAQLRDAATPAAADLATPISRGKTSMAAPANLDALDRLQAIVWRAATWRQRLNLTSRGTLEGDLRSLVGATMTDRQLSALASDADRWRVWCLTLAGWQTPPWRPHAPCPRCDKWPGDRAGLRVHLAESTACCLSCGAAWGPNVVGILAEHVRTWRQGT